MQSPVRAAPIVPATYAIGSTGGHCDSTQFPPSITAPGTQIAMIRGAALVPSSAERQVDAVARHHDHERGAQDQLGPHTAGGMRL